MGRMRLRCNLGDPASGRKFRVGCCKGRKTHGRACPGHPDLSDLRPLQDMDARLKAGQGDSTESRRRELTKLAVTASTVPRQKTERGGVMGMLEGRVAICTGAARGVGAEVAKLMAAHGARVVVVDPGVGGA